MPESQSSKLRKKWPWDWEKEELTDAVQVEIVENLYSYAKDVAYWYPEESDWHYWFGGLEVYCQVSRDYFVKVAKGTPDSFRPKLSEIAEEAFELINMLMEWANQKYSLCFVTEPEHRYYTIPYSDEELASKWDTVVQRFNMCMPSGNQAKTPAETGQKDERSKIMITAGTSKENWEAIKSEYGISKRDFGKKINFVSDSFKRNIIFRDVEHAFVLASQGFPKPAIILAGGVIEELLRLYLENKNIQPKCDKFFAYIEACENNKLLKRGVSRLTDSIRDFRNLVHLANEETKKHTISKATAKGAVSSIFTIANDFQ